MEEKEKIQAQEPVVQKPNEDLVETIKELKGTTVPRDKYNNDISQLQAERKRLLDIIKEGGELKDNEDADTVDTLRKDLASGNLNNLEYIETALKLRSKVLDAENVDIFMAQGHNVDKQVVENGDVVADVLQEILEQADGDSAVFTALLQKNLRK